MPTNLRILNFLSHIPNMAEMMNKSTESSSLYPDLSIKIPDRSPLECLAGIFVVSLIFFEKNEIHRYNFYERIAAKCYKNAYQGKWEQVQACLELKPNTPANIIEYFFTIFSPEDIYGNFIPLIKKSIKQLKVIAKRPREPRVRYPKRKRGYNDKGSCRFIHEVHQAWEWSGENPIREDRRTFISAPTREKYWKVSE